MTITYCLLDTCDFWNIWYDMANKRQNQTQRQRQCRFKYATITESQMLFIEHSLGQELLLGKKTPLFFQSEQLKLEYYQFNKEWLLWTATSSLSFLISVPSSSQCLVYCHLAVFSLSTTWLIIVIIIIIIINHGHCRQFHQNPNKNQTWRRWRCFCSNSSFWSSSLLKLKMDIYEMVINSQDKPPSIFDLLTFGKVIR